MDLPPSQSSFPQSITPPAKSPGEDLTSPPPPGRRAPTLVHSLVPLLGTALLVGLGFGVWGIRLELLLLTATALTACLARSLGVTWREMQAAIVQSILQGLPAMSIVLVVGALVASWLAAGTIQMLIHHGLGLISPRLFLVTASAATCIVSLLTGTGYGTIGTIGVAFMGIAHGLGVPAGQAAGALVAGAYLGHKISPFAANANLVVTVAQVPIYDHIRHCLWTTLPALATGFTVYWLVGTDAAKSAPANALAATDELRAALADNYRFSAWLLLPPVITLAGAFGRRPIIPAMLVSVAVALTLAVTLQGLPVVTAVNAIVTGYRPHTDLLIVDKLLGQGGLHGMMNVTVIALCAFALGSVLREARLLEPVLAWLARFTTGTGRLVAATAAGCLAFAAITGSAFVSIVLPTQLFAPAFRRHGLAPANLSRVVVDCAVVSVPLIPWSIAGAFISRTLGVPVTAYAPWAVFCYAGIVCTLLAGATGVAMTRAPVATPRD